MVSGSQFLQRLNQFEHWLWTQGASALGMGRSPQLERLAKQVVELSDLYTVQRSQALSEAGLRSHLLAKTFYYLLSDAPKPALVLAELHRRYGVLRPWLKLQPFRFIDLGAGVGATALGVLLALDATLLSSVQILGVDQDESALRLWRTIVQQAGRIAGLRIEARTLVHDLQQPCDLISPGNFDMVIAQSVLNELQWPEGNETGQRLEQQVRWVQRWAEAGMISLIEPALKETTRPLHQVRDRLLQQDRFHVLAPCPHQQCCPMLIDKRHWCHEIRTLPPTPQVHAVQELTQRRDERTKYSFLVLTTASHPAGSAIQQLTGRIVSDTLISKGKTERWICTHEGQLVQLRLLDRQRSDENQLFLEASRGAIIRVTGELALPRLLPTTQVTHAN